jgi:hydrogenase maturation factor
MRSAVFMQIEEKRLGVSVAVREIGNRLLGLDP